MPLITKTSYLVVNTVPLATPAWWITNLTPEMLRAPTLKGGDIDIPHAHGGLATKRRRAVTLRQFQMVIVGNVDQDGAAIANWRAGLETNTGYLLANLGIASSSGDGTVPAVWHRFDGTTPGAQVTVTLFDVRELANTKRHLAAVLELSIPAGVFS